MAAWKGTPGLAIGNALGSNTANVGLVLGVTALVTPMDIRSQTLQREMPALLAVTLLTLMLLYRDLRGRLDSNKYLMTFHAQYCNGDIVTDDNFLPTTPCQNEHSNLP